MKVSTMREIDSRHIAELITQARNNIGQDDALPHMGYMMLPDYKPSYAYKYYNIRSRHFWVQEVFFVAHDGPHPPLPLQVLVREVGQFIILIIR